MGSRLPTEYRHLTQWHLTFQLGPFFGGVAIVLEFLTSLREDQSNAFSSASPVEVVKTVNR